MNENSLKYKNMLDIIFKFKNLSMSTNDHIQLSELFVTFRYFRIIISEIDRHDSLTDSNDLC